MELSSNACLGQRGPHGPWSLQAIPQGHLASLSHKPLTTGFNSLAFLCLCLPWLSFKEAMTAPPFVTADLGMVLGLGQAQSKYLSND